jgi:hypothetical protein
MLPRQTSGEKITKSQREISVGAIIGSAIIGSAIIGSLVIGSSEPDKKLPVDSVTMLLLQDISGL